MVRRGVGLVNMAMKREKKFFDAKQRFTDRAFVTIDEQGVILPNEANYESLNLVGQGSGANQRDGRKILIAGLRIRGELRFSASANWIGGDSVRLMLILDTQCNGVASTPSAVLDGAGAGITNLDPAANTGPRVSDLYMNLANQKRYRILKEKVKTVNWTGITNTETPMMRLMPFKMSYKWKNGLACNYNGTSATPQVSNINDCNLFILAIRNGLGDNQMALSTVDCAFVSRLRYLDN